MTIRGRGRRGGNAIASDLIGLNQLWNRAETQEPAWQNIAIRLPESARRPVVFTIDTGGGGQSQKRATLTFDRATGATIRWETFSDNSAGRGLRSWSRFVTGEAFGVVGQTLAGAGSLGGAILAVDGRPRMPGFCTTTRFEASIRPISVQTSASRSLQCRFPQELRWCSPVTFMSFSN